jgi:hypothetical protein
MGHGAAANRTPVSRACRSWRKTSMVPRISATESPQSGIPHFDPERSRRATRLPLTPVRSPMCGISPQFEFSQFDPEHGPSARLTRAGRWGALRCSPTALNIVGPDPITPLECAVTNFASVSPSDRTLTNIAASISKHQTLSRAQSALTNFASVTPLECALTKKVVGGATPLPFHKHLSRPIWLILLRNSALANPYCIYSCESMGVLGSYCRESLIVHRQKHVVVKRDERE